MTQIADLTDRLTRLATRREDEGIYTDAMIASAAAERIAALEAQLAVAKSGLQELATSFYKDDQHQDYAKHVLSALEATPPAPKVTEAMVEVGYAALGPFRQLYVSKDEVRAILTAAQEVMKRNGD